MKHIKDIAGIYGTVVEQVGKYFIDVDIILPNRIDEVLLGR